MAVRPTLVFQWSGFESNFVFAVFLVHHRRPNILARYCRRLGQLLVRSDRAGLTGEPENYLREIDEQTLFQQQRDFVVPCCVG